MFKLKKTLTALSVASAIAAASSAYAQDTGTLRIQVTDRQGNPVPNATVSVSAPDTLAKRTAETDDEGYVRLGGLQPSRDYQVEIVEEGYSEFESANVRVSSGQTFELNYTLTAEGSDIETIQVTGRAMSTIDTTSSTTGTSVTLDMTESLPTARSFQDYLQLAPSTKPSVGGNPSSKSGVNYSDIGGEYGSSSDNVYYLDGVNVTDNQTGTFGANINSEIIQEQRILTGGIPAEYAGGQGLVTRVITKSGGNEWSGSVNYYFQNDSLVADNENLSQNSFDTFDTAVTLGGPIIEDELWFFGSYQIKDREEDVTDPVTDTKLRTITDEQDLGFFKLTWQPTGNDRFVASWFNDPQEISGSDNPRTLNNRDVAEENGGDNYKVEYSRYWDNLILTLQVSSHEGEASRVAADGSTRNDVAYRTAGGFEPTNADTDKGGYGVNSTNFRNKDQYQATLEYFLDTYDMGSHEIKAGFVYTVNENLQDSRYTGEGAQYTSIGNRNSGSTIGDYLDADDWVGQRDLSADDLSRLISNMASSDDAALYTSRYDTNNDGTISEDELRSGVIFDSTEGNPTGDVNVYRSQEVQTAPIEMETKGKTVFLQDTWTIAQWTVNAGIRAETWEHFSSKGDKIAEFDWEVAPRFSVVYDIDGSSKVWGFVGRYYDPIRTNMTDFAGNLTGPVLHEQIYLEDRWLTYRVRGGEQVQDAFFAPSTKTPYTDEILLGYATNIADNMSIEVTYTDRATRDLLEDYDLGVYANDLEGTDFYLPLSYFGYDENPGSNYVIATLEGGKRDYEGLQVAFTKHRTASDNWFFNASWTYNDAKGNTNSDSNADLQGDFVWLDPRAPGVYADQPGNIEHLVKLFGSYKFDNGFEVGAVYNWNSGTIYSKTRALYGRHAPLSDEPYEYGGYTDTWVQEGVIGSQESPAYGTLDLRVKYTYDFGESYKAEFFLDVFNALDDQAARREQDLVAGDGVYEFGEAVDWVKPRQFYLGARLSF
ncbi:TonB-dependent receptor [Idiomarina loihiensis]|jgi:hypothetical protein|uniref:Outer membrane protein n=1 Tax=Idiomarina loihiensis (strain ATCC BAA-735 / DSM 15497 / L2-TR) TaxID=283942 RepID=Q5QVZ1_IDILO|nr:TonB-dependent receptor [Idiomarina loihiensis]AAV83171.1 Outer membrane protein [Idiomarina loihiensis L2TR]AGM37214.1 hypothetical protein K734_11775 [Idiomarina loihiensis GSL 199]